MSRDLSSSMRDARGRPTRGGRPRQFHRIEDLPKVIMGRKDSRLTEQRLVPFEAGRHVAYPYDRPRALHRVPFCGLILVETDLDTTKSSPPAGPTTHVLTLASSIFQNLPYCFMPTGGSG